MDEITTIGCIAAALVCVAHMARPVSRAEKAHLLLLAEGDAECQERADYLVTRKWLTWTEYDGAKQSIERRMATLHNEQILAESGARKVVLDAKRKL
ncbi:hypothetical protein [Janthinobacterium sp. UMAB-56]|uniref:hypothetical protein n=1 Tax=Janthinobacterium sp. UMAB-56 TaxID=1365361 RepID=UPI001C5914CF|nr:hypothetical protein [Janthinobacterium sp. UMAB-56]